MAAGSSSETPVSLHTTSERHASEHRGILAATRVPSTHNATKHGTTDIKTKEHGRLYAEDGY